MKRFLLPIAFSILVVGSAPWVGRLRDLLQGVFPQRFAAVMAIIFGVGLLLLLAAVVVSIRENRLRRYGALALGLGLMALQLFVWNRDLAAVNAVERIHFLYYGVLAVAFYRAFRPRDDLSAPLLTLVAVAVVGTFDEWLQWLVPVRTGDYYDVVLNAYAGLCGLLVAMALMPPHRALLRLAPSSGPLLCYALSVAILTASGFFHCAHLGYEIHDRELGSIFRSYFTREELVRLEERRAREWSREPPGPLQPLAVEDYYRSEAGWRVQHRNAAFHRDDFYQAWKENQILEKYFDPFLELEDRLPEGQRRLLEERGPRPQPGRYYSPVFVEPTKRVFVRPTKPQLWITTAILVAALLVWARLERGSTPRGSPPPADR